MICPTHQTELVHRQGTSKKTGKGYDFWGCPQKDGANFCDFTAPGQKSNTMPVQRDETMGKAVAQIQAQLTRIEEMLKNIATGHTETKNPF